MRDQSVAVERNPFAWVVTRFVCNPVEFGPTVIKLLRRIPTERMLPLFHGHMHPLMLCQRKRFQRAQYALLVNGLKVYRHGAFIVPGSLVAGARRLPYEAQPPGPCGKPTAELIRRIRVNSLRKLVRKAFCQTLLTEDLFSSLGNSSMRSIIRERLAEMKDCGPSPHLTECVAEALEGKVYKLNEIAKLWNCSHEFVRRQFIREPGVIHAAGMYLVPRCVVERVVVRMMVR